MVSYDFIFHSNLTTYPYLIQFHNSSSIFAVQSPPSIVVTTPSASIRQSLLEAQTGKIRQQQFNQFHNNKENIVKTGYTISTPPPDVVKTGYRVGPSTPTPPVIVSSQSGILVNPGQQGTVDGTTTPFPTIINQSHGSTGFQVSSYIGGRRWRV